MGYSTFHLRHRLIGTRANIILRLNDVYQKFTKDKPSINDTIDRIIWMKTAKEWWWVYWNTSHLKEVIYSRIDPLVAKYILWKYENYLTSQGHSGYKPIWFDTIISPELEHIAPQTPSNSEPVSAGYCKL